MFAQIIKSLFLLALCLMSLFCLSCEVFCLGCQPCQKYQDVALVQLLPYVDYVKDFDRVAIIANDSVIGCRDYYGGGAESTVGSKTHNIKFPINARIQLFSQENLWKEFFIKMEKNTVLTVYNRYDCLESSLSPSPLALPNRVKSAKESNRFIDSALTEDYCWVLEKMDHSNSYETLRCIELPVDGEVNGIRCSESLKINEHSNAQLRQYACLLK